MEYVKVLFILMINQHFFKLKRHESMQNRLLIDNIQLLKLPKSYIVWKSYYLSPQKSSNYLLTMEYKLIFH